MMTPTDPSVSAITCCGSRVSDSRRGGEEAGVRGRLPSCCDCVHRESGAHGRRLHRRGRAQHDSSDRDQHGSRSGRGRSGRERNGCGMHGRGKSDCATSGRVRNGRGLRGCVQRDCDQHVRVQRGCGPRHSNAARGLMSTTSRRRASGGLTACPSWCDESCVTALGNGTSTLTFLGA
jgi:hypothetical protein